MSKDETALSEVDQSELTSFVEQMDKTLFQAGADSAEQAFGLGCGIGLLPALVVIVVLFALRVINLILMFVLAVLAVIALIGVATLLAYQARTNSIRRTYQSQVEPEINRYLSLHSLNREEFDLLAAERLSAAAPLRLFLAPLPPPSAVEESGEPGQAGVE